MFNKLKWTIKKIVLFLFYPLVTIKHNFDFEYISTLINNQNIIKANRGKYNNLDELDGILLYHVLGNDDLRLEEFEDGQTVDPLGAGTFLLNTNAGFTITDGAERLTNIVTTNVTAANGIIHAVDNILLPE